MKPLADQEYQKYREKWALAGAGVAPDVPVHLDLELASLCNFRCPMCILSEVEVPFTKAFMPMSLVLSLLNQAKQIGVLSVKLNWRGEAVLHPDFPQIVSHAMSLGFVDVLLNTNGSYTKPAVREAVNSLDTVIFSIDTLHPEVAERIRPGGPLGVVFANFLSAVDSRNQFGHPKSVKVNFTRQKENWDEVEAIQEFCKGYGVDVNIRPVFPRNPPKAGEYYDEEKVTVLGRKNCGFPFQRLVVAHDGRVAPCCTPWNDNLYVGDILEKSLLDIWNDEPIRKIREDAVKAEYQHPTCQNCTSWMSYDTIHHE